MVCAACVCVVVRASHRLCSDVNRCMSPLTAQLHPARARPIFTGLVLQHAAVRGRQLEPCFIQTWLLSLGQASILDGRHSQNQTSCKRVDSGIYLRCDPARNFQTIRSIPCPLIWTLLLHLAYHGTNAADQQTRSHHDVRHLGPGEQEGLEMVAHRVMVMMMMMMMMVMLAMRMRTVVIVSMTATQTFSIIMITVVVFLVAIAPKLTVVGIKRTTPS